MSNIPNKTKPEPMRAERLALFREFLDEYPTLDKRLNEAGSPWHVAVQLLAEVDRLSTALVAANAEIVTERAAHATTREAYQSALDQAERNLAVAMEALRDIADSHGIVSGAALAADAAKALAAITSDAPAKADSGLGVMCTCGHTFGKHVGEEHCTYCSCTNFIAAGPASKPQQPTHQHASTCPKLYGNACNCDARPIDQTTAPWLASKPLVEGFKVGDLVCAARDYGYTWQSNFWVNPDNVEHVTANAHRYRRVEPEPGQVYPGPSAKADEGKAEDLTAGCEPCPRGCGGYKVVDRPCAWKHPDPAPPALTRESVADMIVDAIRAAFDSVQDDGEPRKPHKVVRDMFAALSDGGAK